MVNKHNIAERRPHPLDWHKAHGRSNSSEKFRGIVAEVSRLMRHNGGHCLSTDWANKTAALIIAQLSHVHLFVPLDRRDLCGYCKGTGDYFRDDMQTDVVCPECKGKRWKAGNDG